MAVVNNIEYLVSLIVLILELESLTLREMLSNPLETDQLKV